MATLTMKDLQAQIEELRTLVQAQGQMIEDLKIQGPKGRDRGPTSEGEMTEEHAIRVMIGDLREMSHKDAAILLKLSYGQIYSARKGYTFKKVYKRLMQKEIIGEVFVPEVEETPEVEIQETQETQEIQEGEA